MNEDKGFSFFRDTNGDKCPRLLLGFLVGIIWLVLCIASYFFGIFMEIRMEKFVIEVLYGMATFSALLLGINAFQRIRRESND